MAFGKLVPVLCKDYDDSAAIYASDLCEKYQKNYLLSLMMILSAFFGKAFYVFNTFNLS